MPARSAAPHRVDDGNRGTQRPEGRCTRSFPLVLCLDRAVANVAAKPGFAFATHACRFCGVHCSASAPAASVNACALVTVPLHIVSCSFVSRRRQDCRSLFAVFCPFGRAMGGNLYRDVDTKKPPAGFPRGGMDTGLLWAAQSPRKRGLCLASCVQLPLSCLVDNLGLHSHSPATRSLAWRTRAHRHRPPRATPMPAEHHRRPSMRGLILAKLSDDNHDYQTIKGRLPTRRGWSLG